MSAVSARVGRVGECGDEEAVEGHLDQCWSEWFDGWTMAYTEAGETVLSGLVTDQAALRGLRMRVRDLNLTLIAVKLSVHHCA